MSESMLILDVETSQRRLEKAVSEMVELDILAQLRFLEKYNITLPILTKTKVASSVVKLRTHEHPDISSLAKSLCQRWKRMAEATASASSSKSSSAASGKDASSATPSVKAAASSASSTSSAAAASSAHPSSSSSSSSSSGTSLIAAQTAALPPMRQRTRAMLGDMFLKLVREGVGGFLTVEEEAALALEAAQENDKSEDAGIAAAAAAAVSSSNSSSSSSSSTSSSSASSSSASTAKSTRFLSTTEAKAKSRLEFICSEIESGMWDASRPKPKPDAEYGLHFRLIMQSLPRIPAIGMSVFQGATTIERLLAMGTDDLQSSEQRAKAEQALQEQNDLIMLDWKKKNRAKQLAAAGLEATESWLKCKACGKRNIELTERQTRSSDEPTTKFAACVDCGNRWRFE